jgi:hypothetical protein
MSELAELDAAFNRLILAGRSEQAIERFYAEDARLQENLEPEVIGKQAILARERAFAVKVERSSPPVLHASAVGDGVSFSEWTWDMTLEGGVRVMLNEVARRQWRAGKITHERFYYPKPS